MIPPPAAPQPDDLERRLRESLSRPETPPPRLDVDRIVSRACAPRPASRWPAWTALAAATFLLGFFVAGWNAPDPPDRPVPVAAPAGLVLPEAVAAQLTVEEKETLEALVIREANQMMRRRRALAAAPADRY